MAGRGGEGRGEEGRGEGPGEGKVRGGGGAFGEVPNDLLLMRVRE